MPVCPVSRFTNAQSMRRQSDFADARCGVLRGHRESGKTKPISRIPSGDRGVRVARGHRQGAFGGSTGSKQPAPSVARAWSPSVARGVQPTTARRSARRRRRRSSPPGPSRPRLAPRRPWRGRPARRRNAGRRGRRGGRAPCRTQNIGCRRRSSPKPGSPSERALSLAPGDPERQRGTRSMPASAPGCSTVKSPQPSTTSSPARSSSRSDRPRNGAARAEGGDLASSPWKCSGSRWMCRCPRHCRRPCLRRFPAQRRMAPRFPKCWRKTAVRGPPYPRGPKPDGRRRWAYAKARCRCKVT
mmetsp:Transcript_26833/g.77595  ORF Transcript_26833/g.77595 Transcript_26833/m.77595 type:complete len:300 (+) Transcript_26833:210-1109(+)